MKVKLHLTILIALFGLVANAQTTFQKTFGGTNGELVFSVQQTTDGGYIVAGWTSSFGAGNYDIYLIKIDASGDTLWTKTFGEANNNEMGFSVEQTTEGGYIITGSTASSGAGNADVYLIKTDPAGNLLWAKTFGGIADDGGYSVQQTTDNGYIITGYTQNFGAGSKDVYLIKTDANGDSLWTKTFGGIGGDEGRCIRQTTDGGYIISGFTVSFGAGSYDVYLIKTDLNGDSLWTKTFGGTSTEYGYCVQQTADSGYIITGATVSFGAGSYDLYLIKTGANGVPTWAKTFGGTGTEFGYSLKQTTDGGFIVTGTTTSFGSGNSDVYLIKTDTYGDSIWTRAFGGVNQEWSFSTQQTTDGGYITAGHTRSFGAGPQNVYVIKTDANGNSGCNEHTTNTIITTPTTLVTNPQTQVSSGGIVGDPVTVTGNGGIITTLCLAAAISENNSANGLLTIFPNPFSTEATLKTGNFFEGANLAIYNSLGQQVKQIKNISGDTVTLLRDNLPAGLYFVHLTQNNKIISSNKFVIAE